MLKASISLGDLMVDMEVEERYSPDLVHDILAQLARSFTTCLMAAKAVGMDVSTADDDDPSSEPQVS